MTRQLTTPALSTFTGFSDMVLHAADLEEARAVFEVIDNGLWAIMADADVQPLCGHPPVPEGGKPDWEWPFYDFEPCHWGFSLTSRSERRKAVKRMKEQAGMEKAEQLRQMIKDAEAATWLFLDMAERN